MTSQLLSAQIASLAQAAGHVAAEVEAYQAFECLLVRAIGDLADEDPDLADEAAEHLAAVLLEAEGEDGGQSVRWGILAEQLEVLSEVLAVF